jgi:hypothetical protein
MLYWRNVQKEVLWHFTFLWTVPLERDVCISSVPLKKMLAKLIEHSMAGGLTVSILLYRRRNFTNLRLPFSELHGRVFGARHQGIICRLVDTNVSAIVAVPLT